MAKVNHTSKAVDSTQNTYKIADSSKELKEIEEDSTLNQEPTSQIICASKQSSLEKAIDDLIQLTETEF